MKLDSILSTKLAIGIALVIGASVGASVTHLRMKKAAKTAVIETVNAPEKPGLAFNLAGKDYTEEEVFNSGDLELLDAKSQLYSLKVRKIKEKVQKEIIEREAKKTNKTYYSFLKDVVYNGKDQPTAKEIDQFFVDKRIPPENKNDKQMMSRVLEFMTQEKRVQVREAYVSSFLKEAPIKIYFDKPGALNIEPGNSPTKGRKEAKISIVVFSDFECPFCQNAAPALMQAARDIGESKVKVTFKHFPLPMHKMSFPAHEMAACVYLTSGNDAFWKFHDSTFLSHRLARPHLEEQARNSGGKMPAVMKCMESGEGRKVVESDIAYGEQLKIRGTPTVFINGRKMDNGITVDNLKSEIETLGSN